MKTKVEISDQVLNKVMICGPEKLAAHPFPFRLLHLHRNLTLARRVVPIRNHNPLGPPASPRATSHLSIFRVRSNQAHHHRHNLHQNSLAIGGGSRLEPLLGHENIKARGRLERRPASDVKEPAAVRWRVLSIAFSDVQRNGGRRSIELFVGREGLREAGEELVRPGDECQGTLIDDELFVVELAHGAGSGGGRIEITIKSKSKNKSKSKITSGIRVSRALSEVGV